MSPREILAKLTNTQRMGVYTVVLGLLSLIFAIFCEMMYPPMALVCIILGSFSIVLAVATMISLFKFIAELLDLDIDD